MKYAWIENDRIRDVCLGDNPFECYHPDVAKFYDTQVPDFATNGDFWQEGKLVKPVAVNLKLPLSPRYWMAENFREGMTLAEKTKWDNDLTPEIITVKLELPKKQEGAQDLVDFLVSANVISQASATKIMQ